jgi:uncharacterized membrane protein YsdA (DUF1294 family)
MDHRLILLAIPALIAVNFVTVVQFYDDKQRAIEGRRRISESNLLGLALIGGSPGAFLARKLFRHKTRKEPFSTQFFVIAALQVGGLIGLILI